MTRKEAEEKLESIYKFIVEHTVENSQAELILRSYLRHKRPADWDIAHQMEYEQSIEMIIKGSGVHYIFATAGFGRLRLQDMKIVDGQWMFDVAEVLYDF